MKLIKYSWASFLLVITALAACTKMDDTYKEFLKGGEKLYIGKADSLKSYPGYKRLALSWLLTSDPKITQCKVYWNNRADSVIIPVERSAHVDTIRTIVNNLEEGTYTFDVYTADSKGHSSLKVSIVGKVYGDRYASSMPDMPLVRAKWSNNQTILKWGLKEGNNILTGVELKYTDISDQEKRLVMLPTDKETVLADYKKDTPFQYRTWYLPDSGAIDTLHTDFVSVTPINESEMDKSMFAAYVLPGDAQSAYGWKLQMLWDGIKDSPKGFHTANVSFPHQYTFDLGKTTVLSRFRLWQRGATTGDAYLYSAGNPKRFEIWGAVQPAANGSWTGWTKLLECESFKPSGLPVGQLSAEDKAYAAAGEEFHFPAVSPAVRYIRVKVISNWRGDPYSHSNEITFWEVQQ